MKNIRRKYLVFISFMLVMISCKSGINHSTNEVSKVVSDCLTAPLLLSDTVGLKIGLYNQIKSGQSALYENSFDIETYLFKSSDLELTIPILMFELKKSGYIRPSKEDFKSKVREIFGRTIDYKIQSKYLYVNFNDFKDRKIKYYRNDNSIEIHPFSIFVFKEQMFISQLYALPEIFNYKEKYPEILEFEKKMETNKLNKLGESIFIYRWMDDEELDFQKNLKILVARNKYLFNNDLSQLDYLLENDSDFMEALIRTYNYCNDRKHKIWYEKR